MDNESGFTPNGDLVLLKPPVLERKTASGIVIADVTIEKAEKAARIMKVIDFGEQAAVHARMKGINRGDVVLIDKYSGDDYPVGGVKYLIVRADAVLGPTKSTPDWVLNAYAKSSAEVFPTNTGQVA